MSTLRLFTHLAKVVLNNGVQKQQNICQASSAIAAQIVGKNSSSNSRYYTVSQGMHRRDCRSSKYADTFPQSLEFASQAAVHLYTHRALSTKGTPDRAGKSESKASAAIADSEVFGEDSKLGLFAKFKLMYKKYWYILIPVHVVTSIGWFGGFYYLSKSGVDVPALLQYIHLSETIIEKVQRSDMGHFAIAYLCYKVATPLRYGVTLGGTTVSIKYLVQAGYIKPIPSKNEILKIYEQKKAVRAAAKAEKAERNAEKMKNDQNK